MLTSLKTTVLDPRYAPTGSFDPDGDGVLDFPIVYADDDTRDPSRYAMVYETGDNATVVLGGEATPLNLYYSQAVNWGDNYTGFPHLWNTDSVGNLGATPLYVMPQFDGIEANKDLLSGEASLEMTPSGMFLQSTWNQWQETLDGRSTTATPGTAARGLLPRDRERGGDRRRWLHRRWHQEASEDQVGNRQQMPSHGWQRISAATPGPDSRQNQEFQGSEGRPRRDFRLFPAHER